MDNKKSNRIRLFTSLPLVILSAAIVIASHQPHIELPDFNIMSFDKVLHLGAYLVWGTFFIISYLGNSSKPEKGQAVKYLLVLGLLFGISDEIHQFFIPGRSCDAFDLIADMLGILISTSFYGIIKKYLFSQDK